MKATTKKHPPANVDGCLSILWGFWAVRLLSLNLLANKQFCQISEKFDHVVFSSRLFSSIYTNEKEEVLLEFENRLLSVERCLCFNYGEISYGGQYVYAHSKWEGHYICYGGAGVRPVMWIVLDE